MSVWCHAKQFTFNPYVSGLVEVTRTLVHERILRTVRVFITHTAAGQKLPFAHAVELGRRVVEPCGCDAKDRSKLLTFSALRFVGNMPNEI